MPAAAPGLGFRATVATLALGQILVWAALYYAFSSFVLPMQRELGWSKATLMGANTLGLAMWGAATYAAGAAIDRGHGRAVLAGGAAAGGLGILLWAFVTEPWHFYAVWALMGSAMAFTLYDPAFAILTKRYPDRYRQGIVWLTLVAGFASTLSFPACVWLIQAWGWRPALLGLGALLLFFVAPLHAWALRGPAEPPRATGTDALADATLQQALHQPAFWLLTGCFTLYAFAGALLWAHVMPAFADKGLSETDALAVVVWIGPAQVAGRLIQVWIGSRFSLHAVGSVVLLGQPLALVLFALTSSWLALWLFALLFGLANGVITIVRGGIVPEYFGRTHIGRIGGAMSAMSLLARAAAPLAGAGLLAWLAGYREVMLALAALSAAGVAA
ncbi:MAG: MFS transporter, partial [Aquabacterium sp.]